jgi:hypothetical protein
MLFKKMIAVCRENYTKPAIQNTALQLVKIPGTNNYHLE